MATNQKRQRSGSVAVTAIAKKPKHDSAQEANGSSTPRLNGKGHSTIAEDRQAGSDVGLKDVPDEGAPVSGKNSGPYVYTTPEIDARSPLTHFLVWRDELEERRMFKIWPRAAVREVFARVAHLPDDEQLKTLRKMEPERKFPLVRVIHGDVEDDDVSINEDMFSEEDTISEGDAASEEDALSEGIEAMYDAALEAMKGAPKRHSGWQDVVLQKKKPEGDMRAVELELKGEKQGVEDPGLPYHGRWWWVSSEPAGAEDEPAINKLGSSGLCDRTGMWDPQGDIYFW